MVFKYQLNTIYQIIILLLYQINLASSNYISIPFKILPEDLTGQITEAEMMSQFISNKLFFPFQIGQPSQNIYGTINSLEFELLIKKGEFYFKNPVYKFDYQKSNSFTVIAEKTSSYYDSFDSSYVKDYYNFCVKYDVNNKKCEEYKDYLMKFIFSKKSDIDEDPRESDNPNKINYIEIGLNLKTHYGTKYSLYSNLKENNYISNSVWFLFYFKKSDENQDENEGVLVYGEDPFNFFPNKYNSSNIAFTQGINQEYDYRNYWSIVFNEAKMKIDNTNEEFILDNNVQGVVNHNYKTIVGSQKYQEFIEEKFFGNYVGNGICFKRLLNDKFYYFVCDSNLITMSDIKKKFYNIYLKQIDFNYIFELNANDLFVTRGDKIFFLVVFNKNNPTNSFLLGSIFFKKYFFYFDNNKNQIGFVQENNNDNNNNNNKKEVITVHWYNSVGTVIALIFVFLLIGVGGFYFGRKIYNRRKLRANELEDEFDYNIPKDKKNKFDLEMTLGIQS